MSAVLRRLAVPLVFTLAMVGVLVGLGLWQLQRLAWKEGVLAQIEARVAAAPGDPPPAAEWGKLDPEAYDYRHVRLRGVFEHDKEALVFRASGNGKAGADGPGYLVLTPLRLRDGGFVIVNRGFVPLGKKDPALRAASQITGEIELTGLMRPPEPRNFFTPLDRPQADEWFTRDPIMIAARWGLVSAAPFTVDADAAATPPGGPQGGATVLAIPNDHLSYALTWFGLALGAAGVFAAYAFGLWRKARLSA